jgi:hypothetical protein
MSLGSTIVPYFKPIVTQHAITFGSLLEWRIGIWGDEFGTVFIGFRQFRALSAGLWKPVFSHHAQI